MIFYQVGLVMIVCLAAREKMFFLGAKGRIILLAALVEIALFSHPHRAMRLILQKDFDPNFDQLCFLTRNGKAAQAGFENLNMQAHDQDLWIDFAGRGILLSGLDPSEFSEAHVVFDSFVVW